MTFPQGSCTVSDADNHRTLRVARETRISKNPTRERCATLRATGAPEQGQQSNKQGAGTAPHGCALTQRLSTLIALAKTTSDRPFRDQPRHTLVCGAQWCWWLAKTVARHVARAAPLKNVQCAQLPEGCTCCDVYGAPMLHYSSNFSVPTFPMLVTSSVGEGCEALRGTRRHNPQQPSPRRQTSHSSEDVDVVRVGNVDAFTWEDDK